MSGPQLTTEEAAAVEESSRGSERSLSPSLPAKQEHLVRHAYDLFGRKGIQKATMQDIADAADVSKATIVYYFKTKEELALRTMEWVLARVSDRITRAIAGEESPEGKVRAMIETIFVDPELNRRFYLTYIDLTGQGSRNPRFNTLGTRFRRIVNEQYAALVRSGLGHTFRVFDVDEAAMAVRAIIDGFFLQWLSETHWRETHASYKAACARAVLRYLRGGDAP